MKNLELIGVSGLASRRLQGCGQPSCDGLWHPRGIPAINNTAQRLSSISGDEVAKVMRQVAPCAQDRRDCRIPVGLNRRTDGIQAAVLLAQLKIVGGEIAVRQSVKSGFVAKRAVNLRMPSYITKAAQGGNIVSAPITS